MHDPTVSSLLMWAPLGQEKKKKSFTKDCILDEFDDDLSLTFMTFPT